MKLQCERHIGTTSEWASHLHPICGVATPREDAPSFSHQGLELEILVNKLLLLCSVVASGWRSHQHKLGSGVKERRLRRRGARRLRPCDASH